MIYNKINAHDAYATGLKKPLPLPQKNTHKTSITTVLGDFLLLSHRKASTRC
jgi:hypothetical protein